MAGTGLTTNPSEKLPTLEPQTPNPQLGTILSYAWQLKKDGKADTTIETALARLKHLSTLCNLNEPEQVKTALATLKWKNSSKHTITAIYTSYLKYLGKTWNKPRYTEEHTLPLIPTEAEIDALISSASPKTAALLQLLKETGARIGEATKLKWVNIDNERRTVYVTAEKGSNSRLLPASLKLLAMLNNLPKPNDNVFQNQKHTLRATFEKMRNRTAAKLNNPRLHEIHFHTFRHWKATTEYHKTKDIIHVKTILGHRDIESTMTYINIEQALFLTQNDEWIGKAAKDATEALQLIEAGFEYVQQIDGISLYRKRK